MRTDIRYFLARTHKKGQMNIADAIYKTPSIRKRQFNFTFIDVTPNESDRETTPYVYAKLAKYRSTGIVEVVNDNIHATENEVIENLLESFCHFVYIPEYSAIAFCIAWNKITRDQFISLFEELCEEAYQGFMATCDLEPIADLQTFAKHISSLSSISSVKSYVVPPNPLFGPLWGELKEYLKARHITEMSVSEKAHSGSISTNLPVIAATLLAANPPGAPSAIDTAKELMGSRMGGIGDAALLMAADGYGKATIEGIADGVPMTIKTADTQKSFIMDRDASPEEIYNRARRELIEINTERGLDH